jgi:hypothetical protein
MSRLAAMHKSDILSARISVVVEATRKNFFVNTPHDCRPFKQSPKGKQNE